MYNNEMIDKKIMDFEVGENIQGYYMVKRSELKLSANNKSYMDIDLLDATGEINCKIWDANEALLELFQVSEILQITGAVSSWKNKKQLKITKYRPINDKDNIEMNDFIPAAPIDPPILYDYIISTINSMKNQDLSQITMAAVLEKKEKLMYYPAAKANHHSIKTGLMYHIYRMLQSANALSMVYSEIDLELLQAGIILHDICKVDEMNANNLGLISDYSAKGNLLGHIVMGVELVGRLGRELRIDEEIVLLLQHMILSHHDMPEYGSPVRPMFLEAELLHHIDVIDARVYDMVKYEGMVTEGEFSEPVFSLDKRRIYRPKRS